MRMFCRRQNTSLTVDTNPRFRSSRPESPHHADIQLRADESMRAQMGGRARTRWHLVAVDEIERMLEGCGDSRHGGACALTV